MADSLYFLCSKGVVVISQNNGEKSYKVFLNRYYIGSIINFNNEGLSFNHQVIDKQTFTGAEGRMLADIAVGEVIPKTIITPKPIKVNGEHWTVMMYVMNKYEVRNQRGIVRGKLWSVMVNGQKTWVSENLEANTLKQIATQLDTIYKTKPY